MWNENFKSNGGKYLNMVCLHKFNLNPWMSTRIPYHPPILKRAPRNVPQDVRISDIQFLKVEKFSKDYWSSYSSTHITSKGILLKSLYSTTGSYLRIFFGIYNPILRRLGYTCKLTLRLFFDTFVYIVQSYFFFAYLLYNYYLLTCDHFIINFQLS